MKRHTINKKDILVFDLDDTIYEEKQFVHEGFSAVGRFLEKIYGIDKKKTTINLKKILIKNGRGKVFDIFCKKEKIYSKELILKLIEIYRFSKKKISITKNYYNLFKELKKKFNLYIVTDGNWEVQLHKIKLLKIEKFFNKIYFTDYYGKKSWKPSLRCFKMIKQKEKCSWDNICYFGDNPKKDFKNLNLVGAKTFFVARWSKFVRKYPKSYNARVNIDNLKDIFKYCM